LPAYKFKNWPLGNNEDAVLYWISSPFKGKNNGYLSPVVFKGKKNDFTVYRPWGELPFLKMGYIYCNGSGTGCFGSNLKEFTINVNRIESQTIHNSYAAIPRDLYPLKSHNITNRDQCCQFTVGDTNYIVPCVEIIRAVAGTSPFFINNLISTNYLSDFCDCKLKNNVLHIDFPENCPCKFPSTLKTKNGLREYANFIYNPSLRDWWETVNTNFLSEAESENDIEIKAFIPNVSGSLIRGIGISQNDTVLLLHISLEGFPNLPYTIEAAKLDYERSSENHPHEKQKHSVYEEASGNIILQDKGHANLSNAETKSSDFSNRYKSPADIRFVPVRRDHIAENHRYKKSTDEEQECSAQEAILGGDHKGIEMLFDNAPEFSLPPTFRLLQNALHILKQSHFLKISDFSTDVANSYVIIYSKTTNNNYIAILEFYQAEESNISTLILGGSKNCKAVTERLLRRFQNGNGHWAKEDFYNIAPFQHYLLKHSKHRTAARLATLLEGHIVKLENCKG
jgi:hypothetical protein